MIVLAAILEGLAVGTAQVFNFLLLIVIVRVIISWVNADPYNPLVRFVIAASDPFLKPFRKLIPSLGRSGIDLSPILLVLAIYFLSTVLNSILWGYAAKLKAEAALSLLLDSVSLSG